jgi:poly-gamma-glutamate capsule biosynthesis protein CapA/YwtB (metallophosphatase superfamily)
MVVRIPFLVVMLVAQCAFARSPGERSVVVRDSVPPPPGPVVLRFAGDCLLAAHYEAAAADSPGLAFAGFGLLREADLAMVNLECPVTTRGKPSRKPFTFRMHPRFLPALTDAGIDIVNIANNHIHDFGDIGLFDTISYLDSVGVKHVGAGRNRKAAHTPVLTDVNGRHFAFLGYYGGGEAPRATPKRPGVAARDLNQIANDIASIRRVNADAYIVINLHWGVEKATRPDADQIAFAHAIIDAGADAIIGHHPHVLQGIEIYRGKPIAYSLGNFVFGGNSRNAYETAIFEISIDTAGERFSVIPIGVNQWRVEVLEGDNAARVLTGVERLSRIFPRNIFSLQEVR